jgi:hypothetical protein
MHRHVILRTDLGVRLAFYAVEQHGNQHTAAQYDYALRLEPRMNYYVKSSGEGTSAYMLGHAQALEAHETNE